ncbi:flagellar export chaperone FlgN [Candidatus Latescibacterota bacterium]
MTINNKKNKGDETLDLKKYISELIAILRREIQSFNIVVELLILEEKGLIECDNNLLIKVLEREEDIFSSIACLEKSRMDVIKKIAEQIGTDPNKLTISKLSKVVEDHLKKELVETAHVLLQINEDLKQKKATNNMLIKQGAMIIEGNIRYILKTFGKEGVMEDTYSSNAGAPKISGGIHIDGRL